MLFDFIVNLSMFAGHVLPAIQISRDAGLNLITPDDFIAAGDYVDHKAVLANAKQR